MPSPIIRLSGLYKSSSGANKDFIELRTGYQVVQDGDDWLVMDDDPAILAGPKDVLKREAEAIRLVKSNYRLIATQYVSNYIAEDAEQRLRQPDKPIPILTGLGIRSEYERLKTRFYFLRKEELVQFLTEEMFPFMENEQKAAYVYPVAIDITQQQGWLSLVKIALLADFHGIAKIPRIVIRDRALDSILPSALDLFSIIDGLVIANPIVCGIPMERFGSVLYFVPPKPITFNRQLMVGILEQLSSELSPVTSTKGEISFVNIGKGGGKATVDYVNMAITTVAKLLRYLNDPRTFLSHGLFSPQLMSQTMASIGLLGADLSALNFTRSRYLRQKVAFSFLDKMANLIWGLNGQPGYLSEQAIFQRLLTESTGQVCASIVRHHFRTTNDLLATVLYKSALSIYSGLHQGLHKQESISSTEAGRLKLLRTLRNTTHGAFLASGQFESGFYISSPRVPAEIVGVPHILMWAFMLEPAKVIGLGKTK